MSVAPRIVILPSDPPTVGPGLGAFSLPRGSLLLAWRVTWTIALICWRRVCRMGSVRR
jgi:hypothetical protein